MEVFKLLETKLNNKILKNYCLIVDYNEQTIMYNMIKNNYNYKVGFIINYKLNNDCIDCNINIYLKNIITDIDFINPYKNNYEKLKENDIMNFVNNLILELNKKTDYFNNNIYNQSNIVYNYYGEITVNKINNTYTSSIKSINL